ncbi:hypothetical protein AVXHC19_23590 [Acidovorax sacchari]
MTTKAAIETDAPSSRASSGTIGRMAPSPTPNSSDGPKAGSAIRRQEKESAPALAAGGKAGGVESFMGKALRQAARAADARRQRYANSMRRAGRHGGMELHTGECGQAVT